MMRLASVMCLALFAPVAPSAPPMERGAPEAAEFFETKIRPLFANHCVSCHGPKKQQAELRLDSRTGFLKGSDAGLIFDPSSPEKSSLLRAVRHEGDVKMPPKGKLSEQDISNLSAWFKMGAPWPETVATQGQRTIDEVRRTHWSFLPVR